MQQSPYFNNKLSPEETPKFFHPFQPFNNGLCSPRTLFFGLNLSSSGQNSYNKKFILSKMNFSSSEQKNFLSNKRNYSSESVEKCKKKKLSNNKNKTFTNDNNTTTTYFINDTKASSKKNTTCIVPNTSLTNGWIGGGIENHFNYNYYQCNNYYNQGKSNSSFFKYNKNAYIASVKKNLLPSLSNELKSNSKNNKINKTNNNNVSLNSNNKSKKQSCSKSSLISTSNKKTNESTAFEHLCKTAESLDLEKMVDYIVSSTKVYNRYNDNKENYCNNFNNLINQNDTNDIIYSSNSEKKSTKKNKKIANNSNNKSLNIDTQKTTVSICKCKKVECLNYTCSCLKAGNRCNNLCSCSNCKNIDKNIFNEEL